MSKLTIAVAAFAAVVSLTPAFAQDMKCDEATMSKMNTMAMGVKDTSMKKMATDHMMMASDSMKAGKMDDCMMHMKEAQKSMGSM
jgi:hypothetical protein